MESRTAKAMRELAEFEQDWYKPFKQDQEQIKDSQAQRLAHLENQVKAWIYTQRNLVGESTIEEDIRKFCASIAKEVRC